MNIEILTRTGQLHIGQLIRETPEMITIASEGNALVFWTGEVVILKVETPEAQPLF